MREYYHFIHPHLPSNQAAHDFQEKYMHDSQSFKYSTSFWGREAHITGIFFYKENGKYYEFFSGYELGVDGARKTYGSYYHISIEGELYGTIVIDTNDYDDIQYACQLTPSQFAADIEPHLKYKNQLSSIMNKYFHILHTKWQEDYQDKITAELKESARNSHSTKLLDDFLDRRSH